MQYVSTRGDMPPRPFCEILIEGLAPGGGLVVPDAYPRLMGKEFAAWRHLGYRDLAYRVLSRYIDDIPPVDLRHLIDETYRARTFGSREITPVLPLGEDVYLLRLANGPTLAFKDIALQLLGNLFEYVLGRDRGFITIVGATSGDTGSSAEHAMRGKRGVRLFMLSPLGKMSAFQAAQMYSLDDPNIHNIAVRGVFDDCQDMVKALSEDAELKARHRIGAVNSINWARVAAQIVYYFKAYFAVTEHDGQEVQFAVPSGNFGNVLAGHIARCMGLPIRRLIVATNENDVLDEFFRTGVYRVRARGAVVQTSSPSMDISKASNFERFVYDLVGRDPETLKGLWARVAREGAFDLSGSEHFERADAFGFRSGRSTHADRLATIRRIYRERELIVDPHTADGIKVGLERREPGVPLVCLETAQPAKFAGTIVEAIGRKPPRPAAYVGLESRPQRYEVMDPDVAALKAFIEQRRPQAGG